MGKAANEWHYDVVRAIYGYVIRDTIDLDEVGRAINSVFDLYHREMDDGDCMVEFIGLIYFGGATIAEAAESVYIGERKARYWKHDFDYRVAALLGFEK